jgi:hypothetical protein
MSSLDFGVRRILAVPVVCRIREHDDPLYAALLTAVGSLQRQDEGTS